MSNKTGINKTLFFIGADGKIFLFSRNFKTFFLLKVVSRIAKYSLSTNFSLEIVKESIISLILIIGVFLIFFLSVVVVIIDKRLMKDVLKPSSITVFFWKFNSNDEEISIFDTLNALACK